MVEPPAPGAGPDALREALARWEQEVRAPFLARRQERQEQFETSSGLRVPPVAVPGAGEPYLERQGFPGQAPFTRGIYPSMYRGRLWTMRQYAGFGSAEETNRRYRHLLEQGQTGLSVAFDLPTQMGLDSDHPLAAGEVGRVGVAIDTVQDLADLLEGIPLDQVTVSMTINATAAILLAMLRVVARERGVDPGRLGGTVQNDLLKEYVARGTYIYPPEPSLRLVVDIIEFCTAAMPRWHPISVSGYHIREAGATAAQELGFTLAHGLEYVRRVVERGLSVDAFAGRLSFFWNAHSNLLEEVAKFRAARRLWASLLRERFGASSPAALSMRFHTQTAGSTLTAEQPEVNVVRVTLQALAAALGGTQSLHTNSRDEALGLPTQESATLALRTQQVIALESGVADTADPLGGAYLVEELTDGLEAQARRILDEIERRGGVVAAIEQGYTRDEIHRSAYAHQQAVESGATPVVGVNTCRSETATPMQAQVLDPALARRQAHRLAEVRAGRDGAAVRKALEALEAVARSGENLVPPVEAAVEARATLGEISDCLRRRFGTHAGRRG